MIILVGPPGALIDEVAGELSQATGNEWASASTLIGKMASTGNLGDPYSEETMRQAEHEVGLAFLDTASAADPRILALGPGCLGNSREDEQFADVRARLTQLAADGALVVHLTGSLKVLSHRNGLDGPRLAAVTSPRRIFFTQLSARTPLYEQAAAFTVDTSEMTAQEVCQEILGHVS